jgi:hypothetical protein
VPDADADDDGDQVVNGGEYMWGTHPKNRASHPKCEVRAAGEGRMGLRVPTATGRRYVLQRSRDLSGWEDEGEVRDGTGSELELLTPVMPAERFWRVRAMVP